MSDFVDIVETIECRKVFKIENEFDLHSKVVDFIRRFFPYSILVACLGELQDTKSKRISSYKKGYQRGQPDVLLLNKHKGYNGLCIEFKTPLGLGRVSDSQKNQLMPMRGTILRSSFRTFMIV